MQKATRGRADGASPGAGLIWDDKGALYGTTTGGGAFGAGTVFRFTPGGKETVIYSFAGGTDGATPRCALVRDKSGTLYGTTTGGGLFFLGTVFRVTSKGEETLLHTFGGAPDGGIPQVGLLLDPKGNLYGTTSSGGHYWCNPYSGCGTIFRVDSAGKYETVHRFWGKDSAYGEGPLIRDPQGNLYGTTFGNTHYYGSIFELTAAGKDKTLYFFKDGNPPVGGLVADGQGNFYGTNQWSVFELTRTGKFKILYTFKGGKDGGPSEASLLRDAHGVLYGTTISPRGAGGTIFKLSPRVEDN